MGEMVPEPTPESRRAPSDVLLLSCLILVLAVLSLPMMVRWVWDGLLWALRGDVRPLGFMSVALVRFAVTNLAAYELQSMRPWARWWLVLGALLNVALVAWSPPDVEQLRVRWQAWTAGGWQAFEAFSWASHFVLPLVTLVVLGRPRRDFPALTTRARAAVGAGIGAIACSYVLLPMLPRRASVARLEAPVETPAESALVGEGTVTLRPTFLGKPLGELPAERLSVKLQAYTVQRHAQSEGWTPGAVLDLPWDVRGDVIEIPGVPAGHYEATVVVRRPADADARGDLRGSRMQAFRTGSVPVHLDVPLDEVMRLTAPRASGEVATVTSPVEIAWEPVQGATGYHLALLPDDDFVVKDDGEVTAVLVEPRMRVDLTPGAYGIELAASDAEDRMLGRLSLKRILVVVDPDAPEPVRPANCPDWLPIPMCDKVPVADRGNVEREARVP
jgi:hypothetical protein